MLIGIPISFGIAIFLTEICPEPLRRPIGIAIELLAGIPSIIYGLWGFFVLAPFLQHTVQPFLIDTIGHAPLIGFLFQGPPYGIGLLTAGIVLAIMVLPFITVHHPRRLSDRAGSASRERLRHGDDHMGSYLEDRHTLYPGRADRRHHARPRTRSR